MLAQVAFLLVIVPGHRRGAIRIDGREVGVNVASCHQAHACCLAENGAAPAKRPTNEKPTDADRQACAVCNTVALFDVPATVTVAPPAPAEAGVLTPPGALRGITFHHAAVYQGRGPPA